ncbi:hypothetical protein BRADI_1g78804v3 [Brachypodium distachyon]|uniref:Uncharacterized protein n=1 Tax=Brachypodium distachyon TaxID=15368 RepID=A0A2K2DVU8_BRADI|nr:hypothetical protein BRADI_1g78804v3 [Brachypodium distachyon]
MTEGAVVALAFVRLRYPSLDLEMLHVPPPSAPKDLPLGPLYDAVELVAR